jgi:hypothetical protein
MRNYFYPGKQARYVIGQELKELLKSDTRIERDNQFLIHTPKVVVEHEPAAEDLIKEFQPRAIKLDSVDVSITFLRDFVFLVLIIISLNAA